ncbi:hypothetical protein [Herbaspirillum sp. SJZ107]|uniref:hypothetical protein n=1 Tax=Herbaspirillum sp. SJZ107 TaxID=2572881 RepID=UPI00114DD31E|nr:hypothetical protein [Herbaspirillum sp. SJZ107]TQK10231.1 hypothetical protein FBX97_0147 [Herbaspirillum sp. SJZ107]
MRFSPMLRVEVGGQIVRRVGEVEILAHDPLGRPTIARMRPQLLAGEVLRERLGTIPEIIQERR